MPRVHILSEPFVTQNTRAFLIPLLQNRRRLRDRGFEIRCFHQPTAALYDCDVLALNNKWWGDRWERQRARSVSILADMAARVPVLLYFDRSSTPGSVDADALPLVGAYFKTSLFRDRAQYLRPHYCGRLFSEFYHSSYGVEDADPTPSRVLASQADLAKLYLSWNTALADYSLVGPRLSSFYRYLPSTIWLDYPRRFAKPSGDRPLDLSCRMGLRYKHATIAYQRQQLADLLAGYRRTARVSKFRYFRELENSKIVLSPFGFSEINYKDFEVFIAGALLLKPDMDHLDTWPDLYRDGETYVAHRWDLSDVSAKVEAVLARYDDYLDIARTGQARYRHHVASADGQEQFADRFAALLTCAGTG